MVMAALGVAITVKEQSRRSDDKADKAVEPGDKSKDKPG